MSAARKKPGGSAEIDGQLGARDCTITYRSGPNILAVATIPRDLASLRAEVAPRSRCSRPTA